MQSHSIIVASVRTSKSPSDAITRFGGEQRSILVPAEWSLHSGPLFIEPGSPWQNAYIESFNGRLRNEFLNVEAFGSLKEAQVLAEQHRLEYNHHRPHSALGYRTPAAFAATCIPPASATPTEYKSSDVVNSLMTSGT